MNINDLKARAEKLIEARDKATPGTWEAHDQRDYDGEYMCSAVMANGKHIDITLTNDSDDFGDGAFMLMAANESAVIAKALVITLNVIAKIQSQDENYDNLIDVAFKEIKSVSEGAK